MSWISEEAREVHQLARCVAMVSGSVTGRRCKRTALVNSDRCENHQRVKANLPKFYKTVLRTTLANRVQQILEHSIVEQLDLREELALVRCAAEESIRLYDAAQDSADVAIRATAGQAMVMALHEVCRVARDAASVEEAKSAVASNYAACMMSVMDAVLRAVNDVFQDDHRIALVEQRIRAQLTIAGNTVEGTELTPDQDVLEMDGSIPHGEEQKAAV